MVDLQSQYTHIKADIDAGIQEVIASAAFIKGPKVKAFQEHLEAYTGAKHVIPVGNGTDALQIALIGIAIGLIVVGVFNGSARDVLYKAINICTECVGLG